MINRRLSIFFAILAAALYALNVPLSKLLMAQVSPVMLAGFLYLGAGTGIGLVMVGQQIRKPSDPGLWLGREDLKFVIAMVVLDIAAPILLMLGIAGTSSANVSLLNNFEIVATALIALLLFQEPVSLRTWSAIALVTIATVLLTFEGEGAFVFNRGSVYVLCACLCWGMENNCTKSISHKSSEQIVFIKGIFSGLGSLIIALILGEEFPRLPWLLACMVLGFVSYGLSINFYILAQNGLGAAKTSAFYSVAPFLGVGFSFIVLGERPGLRFYFALGIMLLSTLIMVRDTLGKGTLHGSYVHTHPHRHGHEVHTHAHRHMIYNPMHIHSHSRL